MIHSLRVASAEYDDVKNELVFILEGTPPPAPLPEGVRPDLAVVSAPRMRLGPVRVPRAPDLPEAPDRPVSCTWIDPETREQWTAIWDGPGQSWSTPSRV